MTAGVLKASLYVSIRLSLSSFIVDPEWTLSRADVHFRTRMRDHIFPEHRQIMVPFSRLGPDMVQVAIRMGKTVSQ
jgi:hypothetical protein